MATIVRAHGGWDGQSWTFVPKDVTIKFYSNADEYLFTSNAVKALSQSNFDNANETYGPGNADDNDPVWVQNYQLVPRTSSEMQRDLSAFAEAATIKFVRDDLKAPIYLCEGDTTTCHGGEHNCAGVFGEVKDNEIIYMACRGVDTDKETQGTSELDGSTENIDNVREWTKWFADNKDQDPDEVERQFYALPQEHQSTLLVAPVIKNFIYIRNGIRTYESDPDTFLRQVAGLVRDNSDPELVNAYLADPYLGPLVSQAVADPDRKTCSTSRTRPGTHKTATGLGSRKRTRPM
ncbi:MAG: putative adhesin [Ilumatobacteraceae bacterium]